METPLPQRAIFIPTAAPVIQPAVRVRPVKATQVVNKKLLEDQQKLDAERTLNEQIDRLKKLVLSGVVNNGREPMAFVNGAMIRVGDVVQDARVAVIDDKKGEVTLDLAGKSQVVLRINP
jgi:hypothetical protein